MNRGSGRATPIPYESSYEFLQGKHNFFSFPSSVPEKQAPQLTQRRNHSPKQKQTKLEREVRKIDRELSRHLRKANDVLHIMGDLGRMGSLFR